jgi:cytochrome c oxidase subunit 4
MHGRTISVTTYVTVCVVLVLLTFLTMGVSLIPMRGVWHIVAGLAIGACKATLVVLFFMHALLSDRVTWTVIVVMTFWLGLLLVLTFSDYLTRGMLPFTPGH